MYTIQSLWTMAREQLDVTVVIFNNRSYAILNIELQRVGAQGGGPKAKSQLDLAGPDLDFVQIANGLGVPAVRVDTGEDLAAALDEALRGARPAPHRGGRAERVQRYAAAGDAVWAARAPQASPAPRKSGQAAFLPQAEPLMSRPFLLAQLSDPHIGAEWADGDPVARLAAAVESVRSMRQQPDAVLVSGDLTDNATDAEYEQARELLAPLQAPLYVLPGNHDDRGALRRHFGVPGADGEPVQYSVDLGPLRLVVIDTTRPGEDPGSLDAEQLDWLDAELATAPAQLTLLAMHHPPLITGIPAWDEVGLAATDQRALGEVVKRHPQVRRLVAGHVHRAMTAELGGRALLTAPSTYVQVRLNFGSGEVELADEPAGFALHAVLDGELISHIQPVDQLR